MQIRLNLMCTLASLILFKQRGIDVFGLGHDVRVYVENKNLIHFITTFYTSNKVVEY